MSDNTSVCKHETHNTLKLQPHRNAYGWISLYVYVYNTKLPCEKIHKSSGCRNISPI